MWQINELCLNDGGSKRAAVPGPEDAAGGTCDGSSAAQQPPTRNKTKVILFFPRGIFVGSGESVASACDQAAAAGIAGRRPRAVMRPMRPMRRARVRECKEAGWGPVGARASDTSSPGLVSGPGAACGPFGRFWSFWASGARVGADLSGASRIPFLTWAVGIIFGGG